MFALELEFSFFEFFRVPAVQDDVEAVHGKLLDDTKINAIIGSWYENSGNVALEVTLYGGRASLEV